MLTAIQRAQSLMTILQNDHRVENIGFGFGLEVWLN